MSRPNSQAASQASRPFTAPDTPNSSGLSGSKSDGSLNNSSTTRRRRKPKAKQPDPFARRKKRTGKLPQPPQLPWLARRGRRPVLTFPPPPRCAQACQTRVLGPTRSGTGTRWTPTGCGSRPTGSALLTVGMLAGSSTQVRLGPALKTCVSCLQLQYAEQVLSARTPTCGCREGARQVVVDGRGALARPGHVHDQG